MAEEYYSLKETAAKLNKTEDQVREYVKQGRLKEYLDRGQKFYKRPEVDDLALSVSGDDGIDLSESDSISLGGSQVELDFDGSKAGKDAQRGLVDTEGIFLEPEESRAGGGDDEIGLAPGDDEVQLMPGDTGAHDAKKGGGLNLGDLSSADTSIGTTGINVLGDTDDQYKLTNDALGETRSLDAEDEQAEKLGDLDDDLNMDSVGSGSGLLDLSLQADDTSLGAVLDDILPGDEGPGAAAPAVDMGADFGPAGGDEAETQEMFTQPQAEAPAAGEPVDAGLSPMAAAPGAAVYYEAPVDSGENTKIDVALVLTLIITVLACMAVFTAAILKTAPGLISKLAAPTGPMGIVWYIGIGAFLISLICYFMSNSSGAPAKPKAAKAKKTKKEKPKKEKKPKKK